MKFGQQASPSSALSVLPSSCSPTSMTTRPLTPSHSARQAYKQYQESQDNQGNNNNQQQQQQQQQYGDDSNSPYPQPGGQQHDFTGGRQHAGQGDGAFGIQGGSQFNSHDNRPPQQGSGASLPRPPPLPPHALSSSSLTSPCRRLPERAQPGPDGAAGVERVERGPGSLCLRSCVLFLFLALLLVRELTSHLVPLQFRSSTAATTTATSTRSTSRRRTRRPTRRARAT